VEAFVVSVVVVAGRVVAVSRARPRLGLVNHFALQQPQYEVGHHVSRRIERVKLTTTRRRFTTIAAH